MNLNTPNESKNTTTDFGLDLIANNNKLNSIKEDHKNDLENSINNDLDDILEESSDDSESVFSKDSNSTVNEEKKHNNNIKYQKNDCKKNNLQEDDSYEIKVRKIELLRIFNELKIQGYKISKEYSVHSSIIDMEMEFEILKSLKTKKNALKLSQGFLINAVQALEFLNTQYDPIGMDLVGFSEIISLGVEDYDEVLDELYEKYKCYGRKVEPELKLVLMITASATSFHASKKMLNNIPGMQDQLKKNPSFINKLGKKIVEDTNEEDDEDLGVQVNTQMNSNSFIKKIQRRNKKTTENNEKENVLQI